MSKSEYKYGICPWCNTNIGDKEYEICDNDCGTVYCDCGNIYHIVNDKCLRNHNPNCGVDIEDEEDEENF
jgi:hypothetical protein